MSQQRSSSRFWLVVGLFLSLNTAGLIWIRHSWAPQHPPLRLVTLDVTSPNAAVQAPGEPQLESDEPEFLDPTQVPAPAKVVVAKVIEPARIKAWLPVANATSALLPENAISDELLQKPHPFDGAERLLAVFDRPIVDDSQLNRPLEFAPFHVSPQVAGHWRWVDTDKLALVLDKPLAPGRKFELTSAVDVTQQIQADLDPASHRFHFTTRPLALLHTTLKSCSKDVVTFELTFNQPVAPDDLLRAMVLSSMSSPAPDPDDISPRADEYDPFDNRGFHATVLTKEASSSLTIQTRRPYGQTQQHADSLRIALAAKLAGPGANLPLGSVQVRTLSLPTTFTLVRSQVDPNSFTDEVAVRLYFSTGLSADQDKPKVRVSPAVENLKLDFAPGSAGADSYHAGVVLRGSFQCGQRYSISLPQSLLANDGQTLGDTSSIPIEIPHRPSELRITAGQGILIPDGNLSIDVQCVNINGVRMSGSKLHANNLAGFLQGRNDAATTRSIVHERQRSLDLTKDVPQTVALDLRQLLAPEKPASEPPAQPSSLNGIYRFTVADVADYWNRETTTVAITDLGLTAKRARDGWLVWIASLRKAEPQAGVTITARSYNNQILAQATTDADGLASLSIPDNHPDGAAWLLTAEHNGDLNYLIPDHHPWMIDTVDQSGRAWPDHYEVMLYTDRGVYRPGEAVHLTGILRDRQGHTPPPFPLAVKVTRPDGRVVANLNCLPQADRQGVFHIDYPSSESGQTGVYRFDVSIPGSKDVLGTISAQIESFVPVRIAVQATSPKPRFIEEQPSLQVAARYLFGQPASGLDTTVTGSWQRVPFVSKPHSDYRFGDFSGRNQQQLTEVRQTLDDEGSRNLQVNAPADERPGVWVSNPTATVTETGGRSVSTTCRLEVDTAGLHIGVKPPEKQVVAVAEPAAIDWVLLDGQGAEASPRSIRMSLVRVDYDTNIVQVNGRPVWKSSERLIDIQSNELDEPAQASSGSWTIKCPIAGRYRLRMVDPASRSATQIEFYAATHRSDHVDVPLQQPEQLDLVLDQAKYRPGETARVLIRSPFPGRALLTLEGDRIYDRRLVMLEENSQAIELPIPADARGGLYVSATVIRPIDPQATNWLPHRACGLARLVIDSTSRDLALKLEAVPTALPGSIVKVRAQLDGFVADEASKMRPLVHLWAVDEGILLTTRFTTPKPMDFFHKPRKLAVTSSDIYSHLLPDYLRPASMTRIGADAAKSETDVDSSRRGPVDVPRRAPAVVWQQMQPVGDDGSLTVDVPVPQFTGTLRLMAVAVHQDRYSSTDHRLTVTSPLLVESTWPRAAAPSDKFRVPVKLFNSTPESLQVRLRTDVSGPVSLAWVAAPQDADRTVTVEPNKPHLEWIEVTGRGIGPANIRIDAAAITTDGANLQAQSEAGIAMRTALPLDSETQFTRHRVGEPLTLEPPAGFVAGTTRTTIAISPLPTAELNPALDSLINYPYGCGEQTSSRIYALSAALNWLMVSSPDTDSSRKLFIGQQIQAGIHRLWSMQNRNGGIGYWSGGGSDPWVSAYAAGAILTARDAGFPADAQFLSDLGKYLESVLDGQAGTKVDANTQAFLCRILASIDKPKLGWQSRLSDQITFLDAEGRAHLAAAWIRVGRKDRAASVLPEDTFRLSAVSSSSGRITSRIRQDAVLLQVLLELDPQHAAIPPIVQRLQAARTKQIWPNTLDNATAIAALARYQALSAAKANFTGSLAQTGKTTQFSHQSPLHQEWSNGTEPLTITSQGEGEFYVVRTVEGLREKAAAISYDRQLQVRRFWLDRHGREIDPAKLQVGDLITVKIEVSSPEAAEVPNVAIVDALPGGMEIENPRLATSAKPEEQFAAPDHLEFLDDRAVLFTTIRHQRQIFRYSVRVTTPGRFEWPPVQASSMYDPAFASIHGGGEVVITTRDEPRTNLAEGPDEKVERQ